MRLRHIGNVSQGDGVPMAASSLIVLDALIDPVAVNEGVCVLVERVGGRPPLSVSHSHTNGRIPWWRVRE